MSSGAFLAFLDSRIVDIAFPDIQASFPSIAAADLVLRPDSAGVGLLEFHQLDRMREAGREAARAALPELAALVAHGVRRAP